METLATLTARIAQPGRLQWIGLRPTRLAEMQVADTATVSMSGLEGDHARPGKRAITLIQAEHLPVIASLAGRAEVSAVLLRRNLVISGLNLGAFRNRCLSIGEVHLRLTGPCAPCSRMEKALGPGGYTAMRGHGGWCAEIMQAGVINLGDRVAPILEMDGRE